MKVMFVGDVHCNESRIERLNGYGVENGIDLAVGLGDFGYDFRPSFQWVIEGCNFPWYFIDGNHDNHDLLPHDANEFVELYPNMFYIPRGLHWTWGNTSFCGLGGAFSIDHMDREMGVSMWVGETISESDLERTIEGGKADIFLSHDVPIWVPLDQIVPNFMKSEPDTIHNRTLLTDAVDAVNPRRVIHGHYHHRYTLDFEGVKVDGLGASETHRVDGQTLILEV